MHARFDATRLFGGFAVLASLAWSAPHAAAFQAPSAYHVRDVRLSAKENAKPASLLVRGGRIEAVLAADAETPPGVRVIEGGGGFVVPAFIDAYAPGVFETPPPTAEQDKPVDTSSDVRVAMRTANRKGIQPALLAVDHLNLSEKNEAYRKEGFGALLASPSGELLAGNSALVTVRDAALRSATISPDVYAHGTLRASGGGYPSTVMGYAAQLRQFFMDVRHHRELSERYEKGRPGPRPPHDEELLAGGRLLDGRRFVAQADSMQSIERWLRLSAEIGFPIAISGGREAYRLADLLQEREVPVVLTLQWGEEAKDPDAKKKGKKGEGAEDESESADEGAKGGSADEAGEAAEEAEEEINWEYAEPEGILRERRRKWEETRDCAIRLHEAGVPFAFGSGSGSPKELVKRVRELVEAGLPEEVALAGLTSRAAEFCGVADRLGHIDSGFDATFAVWADSPLEDKAQIAWLFVDGQPYEFEVKEKAEAGSGDGPGEGVDATGTWEMTSEMGGEESTSTAELTMQEDGSVAGVLKATNPMDNSPTETPVEGGVSGSTLTLKGTATFGDMSVNFTITGDLDGDQFSGEASYKADFGEFDVSMRGVRKPEGE